MSHTYYDLVIGGVLIAPFVTYAVASLVALLLLRPLLVLVRFEDAFSNPPLALLCVYLLVLATGTLLF